MEGPSFLRGSGLFYCAQAADAVRIAFALAMAARRGHRRGPAAPVAPGPEAGQGRILLRTGCRIRPGDFPRGMCVRPGDGRRALPPVVTGQGAPPLWGACNGYMLT